MKLIEAIQKIDKSQEETPSWEELADQFNLYLSWSNDERLKCYFLKRWLCTDTLVGVRAYFLDDEFVALSTQNARKSGETFEFASKEKAKTVRDYVYNLIPEDEEEINVAILETEKEIEETFKIEYSGEILHKTALLKGERVEIVKTFNNDYNNMRRVEIKKGKEKTELDCRELDFELNIIKEN